MPSQSASTNPDNLDPIRTRSLACYRAIAAGYDQTVGRTWPYRERAIAKLALKPGDVVLDVGCGTGLSFGLLRKAVGAAGHVIGVEHSPEMAEHARARIAAKGWTNVTLLHDAAHAALLPEAVSAMLFNYTHDICRCRASLENLFSQAVPGARIGIAGIKYFARWAGPLNLFVYLKNRPYNGKPGHLHTPWDIVHQFAPDLHIEPTQFGMGYVAGGTLKVIPQRAQSCAGNNVVGVSDGRAA